MVVSLSLRSCNETQNHPQESSVLHLVSPAGQQLVSSQFNLNYVSSQFGISMYLGVRRTQHVIRFIPSLAPRLAGKRAVFQRTEHPSPGFNFTTFSNSGRTGRCLPSIQIKRIVVVHPAGCRGRFKIAKRAGFSSPRLNRLANEFA